MLAYARAPHLDIAELHAHPTRASLIVQHRSCVTRQVVQGRAANASDDVWSSSTDAVEGPNDQQQSVRVDGETVVLRRNTGAGLARRRGNSADIEAAPSRSPPPPSDFMNDDTRSAHLQLSFYHFIMQFLLLCVVSSSFRDFPCLTAVCQQLVNCPPNKQTIKQKRKPPFCRLAKRSILV